MSSITAETFMTHYQFRGVLLLLLLVLFAPAVLAAEDRVNIEVSIENEATVQASGVAPRSLRFVNGDPVFLTLNGTESSECRPYGRQSSSLAEVNTRILKSSENLAVLEVFSRSLAMGGHYRTCSGGCIFNNCVGNHGNDTRAEAQGSIGATLRVNIVSDNSRFKYFLRVGLSSTQGSISIKANATNGSALDVVDGKPDTYLLNEEYSSAIVDIRALTNAANEGGCCTSEERVHGTVTVEVEKAPILYSSFSESANPFVKNGIPTPSGSYRNVVAIVLGGQVHCTGTLIGKRTILTAAHCIQGYEKPISDRNMAVIFGSTFVRPESIYSIIGYDYPRDRAAGFVYNGKTYEDDIGLLYLEEDPPYPVAPLHIGMPQWQDVLSKKLPIFIVGFGFNVMAGELRGLGVKREAVITADGVRNRAFYFKLQNANTCEGDSGGPSFVESEQGLLAGVTSLGDSGCTEGVNTRIDAYAEWLSNRIK